MARLRRLHDRKGRVRENAFLAEGPDCVRAAVEAGWALEVLATAISEVGTWAAAQGVRVTTAEPKVIEAVCGTRTPQGVVAECRLPDNDLAAVVSAPGPLVVCEQLADPGNLGTIIRTAEAVGAAGVITTSGSVDPWNTKAVRAAAGSSFRVPIAADQDGATALQRIRGSGRTSIALTADAPWEVASCIQELAVSGTPADSLAWLVGSEAHGISNEIAQQADTRARLPMRAPVESLNAAVALSVCLYAAAWAKVPR